MTLLALLLLAAQGAPVAPPAGRPSFITAPVTPEMALTAIDECMRQLRAGAFDHQRLTGAGWVSAIRNQGGDADIRGYRHPDNMILLNFIDKTSEPDVCSVMAPTGRGLNLDSMRSALRAHFGVRPARRDSEAVWELDDLRVALKPMGNAGVVVDLSRRSSP